MNTTRNNPDPEFDKVVEMLTPRFPRAANISFGKPRRNYRAKLWTIGSIAAMLIVIFTLAFKSFQPVSAAETVKAALTNLSEAESVRVDFTILGELKDKDYVYTPSPKGVPVKGTLYILNKDGKVYNRVDWHDEQNNSIIYCGTTYIHLQNGVKVDEHPSGFSDELLSILNFDSLRKEVGNMVKSSEIISDGDAIVVNHRKQNIVFSGEFRKKSKDLVKAIVLFESTGKPTLTLLETQSIKWNADTPLSLFIGD